MESQTALDRESTQAFGPRLRAARVAASLTQRELAHGIMSASQLSLVERGHRRPSVEALEHLAARLNLAVVELAPSLSVVGRERRECRLEQARRAIARGNPALAERLATLALSTCSSAERRMQAYVVRAEAREAMRMPQAALADLGLALDIARGRIATRDFVSIALFRERLRHQLVGDDAA